MSNWLRVVSIICLINTILWVLFASYVGWRLEIQDMSILSSVVATFNGVVLLFILLFHDEK